MFNRWITSEVDADGNGAQIPEITRFVHDGSQIVLKFDGNGDVTKRYLWGAAVDQILADEDGSGDVLWPLADHQGTVRELVDSSGVIANHITYDSYGNVTSETASAVDHLFGYTGRAFDESTELQNNVNRWYDAATGRWLNEDIIGFAARDENLYRYVGNRTTDQIDPTGMQTVPPGYMLVRNPFSPSGEMMLVRDPNFDVIRNPFSPNGGSFAVPRQRPQSEEGSRDCGCESLLRDNPEAQAIQQALERLNRDRERALLAQGAYRSGAPPVNGVYPGRDTGLTNWQTSTIVDNGGFRATLFSNPETGQHVLSFAGTDPSQLSDWGANFGQGMGIQVGQYESAIAIAKSAKQMYGDKLHLVGHSLGGGLASAAGLVNDIPVTVFNPAGPHRNTLLRHDYFAAERYDATGGKGTVTTYRVKGEVLTTLDRLPLIGIVLPNYAGDTFELNPQLPWYHRPLSRHSMEAVVAGIDIEIRKYQRMLTEFEDRYLQCLLE